MSDTGKEQTLNPPLHIKINKKDRNNPTNEKLSINIQILNGSRTREHPKPIATCKYEYSGEIIISPENDRIRIVKFYGLSNPNDFSTQNEPRS